MPNSEDEMEKSFAIVAAAIVAAVLLFVGTIVLGTWYVAGLFR